MVNLPGLPVPEYEEKIAKFTQEMGGSMGLTFLRITDQLGWTFKQGNCERGEGILQEW